MGLVRGELRWKWFNEGVLGVAWRCLALLALLGLLGLAWLGLMLDACCLGGLLLACLHGFVCFMQAS